jgi:lipoate-protein ligase A
LEAARPDDPLTIAWSLVDASSLVLGRGSKVATDDAACAAAGVTIVRRASGGGPVLWDEGLIGLDIVIPKGHSWHTDDVVGSYQRFGELTAAALHAVGIAAEPLPPDRARAADDTALAPLACFAGRSPWEVVAEGHKVVGLSQVRRRQGVLVQAGIALWLDGNALAALLRLTPPEAAAVGAALGPGTSQRVGASPDQIIAAVECAIEAALPT